MGEGEAPFQFNEGSVGWIVGEFLKEEDNILQ